MDRISREEARRFLVHCQGLSGEQPAASPEAVMAFFARVGSIQYDPLNVVGRNADLVLQARFSGYTPDLLQNLLYGSRRLMDGYDKEMCIFPAEDFPRFARLREARVEAYNYMLHRRGQSEALTLLDEVRQFVADQGPAPASKLSLGGRQKSGWGHTKLSSAALDRLLTAGVLSVSDKRGTQKVYDLTERAYPQVAQADPFASQEEFLRWYVKRRVGSVGLLWNRRGGAWLGHFLPDPALRQEALDSLAREGSLLQLQVEGVSSPFYLRAEDAGGLSAPKREKRVRFLAPLDNLLWDRGMVETLFGFHYSWEVYLPREKRKYGYYVLPVLYGDDLVARFEPVCDRDDGVLRIQNWWWEKGAVDCAELREQIAPALERFCAYLGLSLAG